MDGIRQIQMIVFDWAGTTVDYGSSAPAEVFNRVFKAEGILLTREDINKPMGLEKKAHIRALLKTKSAENQWMEIHHREWTEEDVERLYQAFEAELFQVVAEYSVPIPGVVETVNKLREQGLKIGSTTGYNSHMMEQVTPRAKALGYEPDCLVTPDITGCGRPSPFMLYECMRQLNVYPPESVIKVGDTVADILEGKQGGAWAVGILTASNLLGLSQEEYEAMDSDELHQRKCRAADQYREAGADLVIDSILDLPLAVEEINRRLAKREEQK